MAIFLKNSKEHMKALNLIIYYANHCPKCDSNNIANEDDSSNITCHDCSHQYDDEDHMKKNKIIKLLKKKGLDSPAEDINNMEENEFLDFLANHMY